MEKSEDESEEAQEDLSNHQLLMIKNVDTVLNLQETIADESLAFALSVKK